MAPGDRELRKLPCEGNGCEATRLTLVIQVGDDPTQTRIANTVRTDSYIESRTTLKCGFVTSEEALSLRGLFLEGYYDEKIQPPADGEYGPLAHSRRLS